MKWVRTILLFYFLTGIITAQQDFDRKSYSLEYLWSLMDRIWESGKLVDTTWRSGWHDMTQNTIYNNGTLVIEDFENGWERIIKKGGWEYDESGEILLRIEYVIHRSKTEIELLKLLEIYEHEKKLTFEDFIEFLKKRAEK